MIVSEPEQTKPAGGAGAVRRAALKTLYGFLFPAGLAMALGGCMLATDQRDPALDVPGRYKNGPAVPDAAPPALDWWRGFRSVELTRLAEEAQTVNLDIAAAKARVVQADAQARIAGAPLLPAITGDFYATQ